MRNKCRLNYFDISGLRNEVMRIGEMSPGPRGTIQRDGGAIGLRRQRKVAESRRVSDTRLH